MITEEMSKKYMHVSSIADYPHGEQIYYKTFLIQTDYIAAKVTEMLVQGIENAVILESYGEILLARQYARGKINELQTVN